jgi:CDP-diacylglycerol--glycerol-3-phosphate 3-phosphatidyltransferase
MLAALPNAITASRGLAGPIVAVLVLGFGQDEAAFAVFLVAILTDLVDGSLARALGATSRLGRWLDPVADKMLADTTWLTLGIVGWAPWWLVGAMLARDAVVTVGWWVTRHRSLPAAPPMLGRLTVSFEGVALPVLLFRNPWLDVHWPSVGVVLGGISVTLAVLSAVSYLPRLGASRTPAPVLRARPWPRRPSTPT